MMMTVVVVEVKMKRLVAMLNHGDAGGGVEVLVMVVIWMIR